MAIKIGSLLIRLAVEHGILQEGLARSERDVAKTTKAIQRRAKEIADFSKALAIGVAVPVAAIAKASIEGAIAQRQALAQVESALTSMGGAAGRSAEQLAATADALEVRSLFDADVILKQVTANLLTFGNVAGEQFDRAQQAAIDMATRLGGEPQAAAIALGKALNDPIKGITALTRVGVDFTEAQKAQIRAMADSGDVAAAQGVILGELERQFSGAAAAAANASPFRQFQVVMGQIADTIGEALLPYIFQLRDAVERNREAILAAAQTALEYGGALVRLVQALSPVIGGFIAYRAALIAASIVQAAYVTGMTTFAFALTAARGATLGLNAALIANPFTAVAVAVGVLAGSFITLANAQSRARAETDNLITSLRAAAQARSADFTFKRNALARQLKEENKALVEIGRSIEGAGSGATFLGASRGALQRDFIAQSDRVREIRRELREADQAYADAGKAAQAMTVPTANATASVAALGKQLSGAGGAARVASDDFQGLYDRLFPLQAAHRKFAEEMAAIQSSRLSTAEKEAAISRLEGEAFRNRTQGLGKANVSGGMLNTAPLVDFSAQLEETQAQLVKLAAGTNVQTVQIAESFRDMADKSIQALDRFASAIKGGGLLDILGSLIGFGLQLGSAGVFGQRIATNINAPRIPGNANGTAFHPGGLMEVGERGPELLIAPRGSRVVPNHELRQAGSQAIRIILDERTDIVSARIDGRIGAHAGAIASGGAALAESRLAQRQSRRIR